MVTIDLIRKGEKIAHAEGCCEASLLYMGLYEEEDVLLFEGAPRDAWVQVDQAVSPARMYLPEGRFEYCLPLAGDGLQVYAPGAFTDSMHLVSVRPALGNPYRNLAENPADQRGTVQAYPHASANVETRNESVFAARNTIDGVHIANGHGIWPYGSWGIGARTDAELTLDFGRQVEVDKIVLYLRADFPHDAHWVEGSVLLDDHTEKTFPLKEMDGPQEVLLDGMHRIRTLKLHKLIKSDHPSAFPALRQIEVWGRDI